jgi:alpha-soluble NSF attachment protein
MFMNFPNQSEYMLLQNVISAIESGDEEAFSEHLFQFSQVHDLDRWKVQLFLHIKNSKFFQICPLVELG